MGHLKVLVITSLILEYVMHRGWNSKAGGKERVRERERSEGRSLSQRKDDRPIISILILMV